MISHRVASFILSAMVLGGTCLSGAASTVAVTNYCWLQLPAADVTPLLGSANGVTGSGYGAPADFRWGDHVWIPNGAMTANGTQMYYAAIRLDQAREINQVMVQWWTGEGTALTQFYVDVSTNGADWTSVGSWSGANPGSRTRVTVDVANTTSRYVRVRQEAGGYAYGKADRGGPGVYAIEPVGNGVVNDDQVNWAQRTTFGTSVANKFDLGGDGGFLGTRYNDGFLFDDEGVRTGDQGNWEAGEYAQIDLKATRGVQSAVIVWDSGYCGSSFQVQYSNDGTSFTPVANPGSPIVHRPGASEVQFDPVKARYFRIVNAVGGSGYNLLNQVLLMGALRGPPTLSANPASRMVRAPAAASFSITAAGDPPLVYQWQRNGVDIDGATTAAYTLSPTVDADNGATFRALVSNDNGAVTSTVANLTVFPALTEPNVAVANYNWLQLPAGLVTPLWGSQNGTVSSGFGQISDFRWGNSVWLPSPAMTANGTQMYYAGVQLTPPRLVSTVWVQWWGSANTTYRSFYVDGSSNGTTWTQIGSHDYGAFQITQQTRTAVDVTDGLYGYVRVRLMPGDYQYISGGYGGPGFYAIEPVGSDGVRLTEVNWANSPNFATVVGNKFDVGGDYSNSGTRCNDGFLYETDVGRSGDAGNWETGEYCQIDLKQSRWFDRVVLVANLHYGFAGFTVSVSNDGVVFTPVTNPKPLISYPAGAAVEKRFDRTRARYVRVSDAIQSGGGYALLTQFLVLGSTAPTGTLLQVR